MALELSQNCSNTRPSREGCTRAKQRQTEFSKAVNLPNRKCGFQTG
jgi:hypothetical protein